MAAAQNQQHSWSFEYQLPSSNSLLLASKAGDEAIPGINVVFLKNILTETSIH